MLLLVCFSSISRWCWIRSLSSLGADVDCWDKFLLLEIMLTSSLKRLEDWLSWPSSKRSTCSSNSLSRVINVVCLFNIDEAVLWCGCCLITSSESFLSSASWPLILLIIKDNDRKLLFCSTVFSEIEQFLHWHFCRFEPIDGKLTFSAVLLRHLGGCCFVEADCWCCWWSSSLLKVKNGFENRSDAKFWFEKRLSKVWMLMILVFSCSKDQRRNFSQNWCPRMCFVC